MQFHWKETYKEWHDSFPAWHRKPVIGITGNFGDKGCELAEAYYNRGLIHIELNNYQQAYLDLSKAGELGLYSAYSLIKHFRKQQQTKKP